MVFGREMNIRYGEMINNIEIPIREMLRRGECEEVEGGNARWKEETLCVCQNINELIERVGRVWDKREIEQFFSFAKKRLEKVCRLLILGDLSMKEKLEKLSIEQERTWKTFDD